MARDSSGNYSAPSNSFNPAVSGATISETDWNATLADIETEITDSLSRSGKGGMSAALDMNGYKVTDLGTPTNTTDAATKAYVDGEVADYLPLAGGTMTGAIAMGTSKITGMGDPTNAQDAATKAYVDGEISGLGALASGSDAGDVPFTPTGNIAATDVQAAIAEVDSETDSRLDALEALSGAVMWFKDVKADGTDGGTFTSGAWQTRDLNDDTGTISGASLATNQITLPAGTYEIWASVPAYRVGRHQAKLRNVTDSADALLGSVEYTNAASSATAQSVSIIAGTVTIAGAKAFEVQHYAQGTFSTEGFGLAGSFGSGEVYTQVMVRKIG